MSAHDEIANAAYQVAVDATVTRRAPVRRGYFLLANVRHPFAEPPESLDEIDRAQLREVFGDHQDERAQFVDLIDLEHGKPVNRLLLYSTGGAAIFEAGTDTRFATITQHGLDGAHKLHKAWRSSFARAWLLDAASLGLWDGHILFDELDLGEPDDDE